VGPHTITIPQCRHPAQQQTAFPSSLSRSIQSFDFLIQYRIVSNILCRTHDIWAKWQFPIQFRVRRRQLRAVPNACGRPNKRATATLFCLPQSRSSARKCQESILDAASVKSSRPFEGRDWTGNATVEIIGNQTFLTGLMVPGWPKCQQVCNKND